MNLAHFHRYIRLTDISVYGIHHGMIMIRLNEILEERGQTVYWLWKQTGIRYATVWQMNKGEIARLNLDALDRICEALECQPGDLLVRVEGRKKRRRGK
jgi:putative transcriptional regulator